MKGFSRFLQLSSLLLFLAIVWPGGSQVSVAVDNGSLTPNPLPQQSPEILSFTATPSRVFKGEAATLRWQVSGAEHIWVSTVERVDAANCLKQSSGEMQVTPNADTIYRLHAWSSNAHVVQELTVQVAEFPSGTCKIVGQITNDRRVYATTVGLYALDSKTPLLSTDVDNDGFYGFSGVPAGIYQVIPTGKYPDGKLSIGPIPRSRRVVCQPNVTNHTNFRIGSTEG
jgi:hypothetical protein